MIRLLLAAGLCLAALMPAAAAPIDDVGAAEAKWAAAFTPLDPDASCRTWFGNVPAGREERLDFTQKFCLDTHRHECIGIFPIESMGFFPTARAA
jgi:hypothetical protein